MNWASTYTGFLTAYCHLVNVWWTPVCTSLWMKMYPNQNRNSSGNVLIEMNNERQKKNTEDSEETQWKNFTEFSCCCDCYRCYYWWWLWAPSLHGHTLYFKIRFWLPSILEILESPPQTFWLCLQWQWFSLQLLFRSTDDILLQYFQLVLFKNIFLHTGKLHKKLVFFTHIVYITIFHISTSWIYLYFHTEIDFTRDVQPYNFTVSSAFFVFLFILLWL